MSTSGSNHKGVAWHSATVLNGFLCAACKKGDCGHCTSKKCCCKHATDSRDGGRK